MPEPASRKSRRGLPGSHFRIHPCVSSLEGIPGQGPITGSHPAHTEEQAPGLGHRLETLHPGPRRRPASRPGQDVGGGAHLAAAPSSHVQPDSILRFCPEDSLRTSAEPSARCGQRHLEMGVFICSGRAACGKEGSEVTGTLLSRSPLVLFKVWWLRVLGLDP